VSSSREREESVERLLRQSLKAPQSGGVTDGCLDAETFAAMLDGGLSATALNAAHAHLADCARCQSLMGAMALIDSATPAEPKRSTLAWLKWAVPLSAAAAVVAVWVAVPHREAVPLSSMTTDVQPQASVSVSPAPPALPAPIAPVDRQESSAGARAVEQPQRSAANELRRDTDAFKSETLSKEAAAPAPAASEMAAAPTVVPPTAPPAARQSANALDAAAPAQMSARLRQAAGTEVVSPDPMVRWLIRGSTVQRSADGGNQWEMQSTGTAVELTAGSAPSSSVVWIVGRAGTVLLSTDGRTWRRVPFPEVTDLSAVRARDASSVSITTADGRPFSTTDAGTTWDPRPLQDF
jgi:hypothetical protein